MTLQDIIKEFLAENGRDINKDVGFEAEEKRLERGCQAVFNTIRIYNEISKPLMKLSGMERK